MIVCWDGLHGEVSTTEMRRISKYERKYGVLETSELIVAGYEGSVNSRALRSERLQADPRLFQVHLVFGLL